MRLTFVLYQAILDLVVHIRSSFTLTLNQEVVKRLFMVDVEEMLTGLSLWKNVS